MPKRRLEWIVRPVESADRTAWDRLYRTYGDFYGEQLSADHLDLVWRWIHEDRTVIALVAVPATGGEPVGLAHLRPFVRPLDGNLGGFLDDLVVAPEARGSGVVDAMFAAIRDEAARRGWSVVRWITAADNHRARAAYDRVATATPWVTYDMDTKE
ncbi:MAG TPA: GNAT family N-acetyltransferase [Jiangellaceae bacterium]|nr:GNAT family N-acetyltransferase [Jiangellaceae bacterium]